MRNNIILVEQKMNLMEKNENIKMQVIVIYINKFKIFYYENIKEC